MSVLRPTHGPRRDVAVAWVATAVVVGLVAFMPAMPTVFEAVGVDLEGGSFLASLGVFVGFVLVVDALAVTAFVLGRRAARAGRFAGRVAMVVSATVAGFVTFLMLAAAVGHLLGLE